MQYHFSRHQSWQRSAVLRRGLYVLLTVWFLGWTTACASTDRTPLPAERVPLRVVTTTSIVGDVVTAIAGDTVMVTVLMPAGTDPHSFEPSPKQMSELADADLIFANGLDLEESLVEIIHQVAPDGTQVIMVSDEIEPLFLSEPALSPEDDAGDPENGHGHAADPHVWTDPQNVMIWAGTITRALAQADPSHTGIFEANLESYQEALSDLDRWIQDEVGRIPPERRKIVTDHAVFNYFASRYGFTQIGTVIPGFSTLAEPSAKSLATLVDQIRAHEVPAIFVGNTVNPNIAERLAADAGAAVLLVYTGSLSDQDGPAATYLDYMRYNTETFVKGLQ